MARRNGSAFTIESNLLRGVRLFYGNAPITSNCLTDAELERDIELYVKSVYAWLAAAKRENIRRKKKAGNNPFIKERQN